jgi:CRP-like cAMP-binding protein
MADNKSKTPFKTIFKENEELVEALGHRPKVGLIYSELIKQMGSLVNRKTYEVGDAVLKQGETNNKIMFLEAGKLAVLVDEKKIFELIEKETMIGEISSITGELCSASIVVESRATLLEINVSDFADKKAAGVDLENLLLRLCSKVLSDKLRLTNDKAKQFVETNIFLVETQKQLQEAHDTLELRIEERTRDLNRKTEELELQNDDLNTAQTKLLDDSANREATLQKLANLKNNHLRKMRQDIVVLSKESAVDKDAALKDLTMGVDMVLGVLDSLDTVYQSEKTMSSARVLLAEDDVKQKVIAKSSLAGTGVKIDVARDLEEGRKLLEENDYDVVCVNKNLLDVAQAAYEKNKKTQFVFMTSNSVYTYFETLGKYPYLSCIVSRNEEDRSFTIKNIRTTVSKLVNGDFFGLEKYINWGVDIKSKTIVGSEQRCNLVSELGEDLKGLGLKSRIIAKCKMVAEELLTNAIYDAPKDKDGNSVYNYQSREQPVELKEHEYGKLRYSYDGIMVAISVEDPFGGFPRSTILDYLESCFKGNPGSVDEAKGGGGLGLFQIMQNSNLVIFNVKNKVKTEVIALLVADARLSGKFGGHSFQYFYQD